MVLSNGSYSTFVDEVVSHIEKVSRAKEDFRSLSSIRKPLKKMCEAMVGTIALTRKLDTVYATSVSRKLCVSFSSSIITF